MQSAATAVITEGDKRTKPTETQEVIWDNASEFEKAFQLWW